MANEWLWFILLVFNFVGILLAYRLFGRAGLIAWVPISIIIANLQVIKIVELFGITASLGNIVYATSFLATDILSENHGRKDAGWAVGMGFIALVALTLFMNITLLFEPSTVDNAHGNMSALYRFLPRIALASFIAYGVSQIHDIWIYSLLKRRQPGSQWIWIRNNLSTMLSQIIDSIVFCAIAFVGVVPVKEFWEITVTTYLLKWLVAIADTPLVYLARYWKKNDKIVNR